MTEHIYDCIIKCFNQSKNDKILKDLSKNRAILKLMRNKHKIDPITFHNALIIILALYDDTQDLNSSIGVKLNKKTDADTREIIKSELKKSLWNMSELDI